MESVPNLTTLRSSEPVNRKLSYSALSGGRGVSYCCQDGSDRLGVVLDRAGVFEAILETCSETTHKTVSSTGEEMANEGLKKVQVSSSSRLGILAQFPLFLKLSCINAKA